MIKSKFFKRNWINNIYFKILKNYKKINNNLWVDKIHQK